MDDIRNLDTVSDRKFTVPMGLQGSKVLRCPWHKPVLRRAEITLYTRQNESHSFDAVAFGPALS